MKNNLIKYKKFDYNFFEDEYEFVFSNKDFTIESAQSHGDSIHFLYEDSITWITLKYINEEINPEEIKKYFELCMEAYFSHIKTIENLGQEVPVIINSVKKVVTNDSKSYNNIFELLNAYNFASICRNKNVKDLVFNQPFDGNFIRKGVHENHPSSKAYYLFKNEREVDQARLDDFYTALIENVKQKDLKEYKEKLMIPLGEVYKNYFLGNAESFNLALEEALELNKAYYDTEKDDRCRDSQNWLPWNLISLACKAYDKGWEITVKDTRLPMFMIRGECNVPEISIPT